MSAHRYLLLNKPYDVLSQFSGLEPATTLRGYVPVPDVYPVGRLDRDSEGLLLLTDDGPLAHRLTDPRFEHPKHYWVQVERVPDEAALRALRQGVVIEGRPTRPAAFTLLAEPPELPERPVRYRKHIPTAWLDVELREGRNRQIRKMTAAVGFPTLRIYRYGLGPVRLGDLPPGTWRDLTPPEVQALQELTRAGTAPRRPAAGSGPARGRGNRGGDRRPTR